MTLGKGLRRHSEEQTGIRLMAAPVVVPFDWNNLITKNSPPPGKNQGSSGSCTSQATGYGVFEKLGIDISRRDMYSNTFLPGGGAYLVSPGQFLAEAGYGTLTQFPDPEPETEENMEAKIPNISRLQDFNFNVQIQSVDTIDAVAHAIMEHDIAIIGIHFTEQGFASSWTHPTYSPNYSNPEGHALFCLNPIISNGLKGIDCMSSWTGTEGPDGPSTHHVIDENFFAMGGVFELLTIDITKRIKPNMQLVRDNGTIFLLSTDGKSKIGIANADILTGFFPSESIIDMSTANAQNVGTLADSVVLHK